MNISQPFCGSSWKTFEYTFSKKIYGQFASLLNLIGAPLNLITVIVFVKKNLPASSSNTLCSSLAISDFAISILCFPQMWINLYYPGIFTLSSVYRANHVRWIISNGCFKLQKVFYNISCLHTMMLAIWRYIAVTHPLKERYWCNLKVTFEGIGIIYVVCFVYSAKDLFCVVAAPQVVMIHEIGLLSLNDTENSNKIRQILNDNLFQPMCDTNFLKDFYSMFRIVILRTTPCVIIALCTVRFVYVLKKSKKPGEDTISNCRKSLAEKQKNLTTKMILGIMIFYLVNNTFGIIGSGLILIYGEQFEQDCYKVFDGINNLLVLAYTSIPFILYYSISEQFRNDVTSLVFQGRWKRSLFTDEQQIQSNLSYLDRKSSEK
ncbi:sex peptide receptor-like [Planococcus citri]|uniref:sex peptide receptor-like n=1 Tax=Planococcus citri TaxID=170843 RepID=UPI0031FA2BB1